jgi:hypothetical protein
LVFIQKKSNQTSFFKKKKPKSVQTDQFWFGSVILGKTLGQTVWLGFS